MMRIIIVEDEPTKRITMHDTLKKADYNVSSFASPVLAIDNFKTHGADLVITDIRMPEMTGFEVLKAVKEINQSTCVIMMTAHGTIESAVEAMKLGAIDYITKPFPSDHLLLMVNKVRRVKDLENENLSLKNQLHARYSFHNIIGKSKVMQELYAQLETIAPSEMAVLIEGKSGTGKEMVANAIHYNSMRKDKPFIKLSCAILNESLLESELFGHEKGAFTGALKKKRGRFELADGGTIFLDDVDDIPLSFQVKLLRVLQEKEFERVGSENTIKVNVRIICATKIDLWKKVEKGEFREDLYYRLCVIPVKLPQLMDRKEDIPLLIEHFLEKLNKSGLKFSNESIEILTDVNWPGNVRQLENAVSRIIALSKNELVTEDMIPKDLLDRRGNGSSLSLGDKKQIDLDSILKGVEIDAIKWALEKSNGNQSKAAELLKIKRTTMRDKMKKHGLN